MARTQQKNERTHLRPKDISERIGVAVDTVLEWINSKKLAASNIGGGSRPRWIIKVEDLDAFIAARSNQSQQQPRRVSNGRRRSSRTYL